MSNKIGVGIVTYNRPEFFKKCVESIPNVDTIAVVNDGSPYDAAVYPQTIKEIIQHSKNKSVGVSKNELMRYLIQDGCEHIFILEDDIAIIDPNVFTSYIKGAEASGIWHLMYGYHGPANKHPGSGEPNPRTIVEYSPTIKLAFNQHCVGAFCYYLKGVIKEVGYIDERFFNAWDHLEHSYRIVKAGLLPAYWWWPDIFESNKMIADQDPMLQSSVIRKKDDAFMQAFQQGAAWFKYKHGNYPTQVVDISMSDFATKVKTIKDNYARNVL